MVLSIWIGAPFVPSKDVTGKRMIELLQLKPGQTLYDLGSGDGRLLIAAAQRGARAVGVEVIPHVALLSVIKIFLAGKRRNICVRWGNYWWVNLTQADAVAVYAMPGFMPRLARKFKRELKPGTPIVSNSFTIPGLTLVKQETVGKDRIFLYTV